MQVYAASLASYAFRKPGAASEALSLSSLALGRPPASKKEEIIRGNTERLRREAAAKLADRWRALKTQLAAWAANFAAPAAAVVAADPDSLAAAASVAAARLAAALDVFLCDCVAAVGGETGAISAPGEPAAEVASLALSAGASKLVWLLGRWKTALAGQAARPAELAEAARDDFLASAVAIWTTAQELASSQAHALATLAGRSAGDFSAGHAGASQALAVLVKALSVLGFRCAARRVLDAANDVRAEARRCRLEARKQKAAGGGVAARPSSAAGSQRGKAAPVVAPPPGGLGKWGVAAAAAAQPASGKGKGPKGGKNNPKLEAEPEARPASAAPAAAPAPAKAPKSKGGKGTAPKPAPAADPGGGAHLGKLWSTAGPAAAATRPSGPINWSSSSDDSSGDDDDDSSSDSSEDERLDGPLSIDIEAHARGSGLALDMSEARFQLLCCGPNLLREGEGGGAAAVPRDPRTDSFVPDAWQRRLLDIVDAGGSAVVTAPTSAGKTFCSSYVIFRVLNADTTGVAIFVCPSDALVHQVAAQIYRDFGLEFGIYTREVRQNVLGCRVLVTIPACLEDLLLTAAAAHQEWVGRIRYAVFDEVHCVGDDEPGGAMWEHALLLLRCPFLALSATVGNPNELTSWLSGAKLAQYERDVALAPKAALSRAAYDVQLIEHSERYSDLRTAVFLPSDRRVQLLHPFWAVEAASGEASRRGHLAALSHRLEPRDAARLYDVMSKVAAERAPATALKLDGLSPDEFFGADALARLQRSKVREYGAVLTNALLTWDAAASDAVLRELVGASAAVVAAMEGCWPSERGPTRRQLAADVPALIDDLASRDCLPAIIFNHDWRVCMRLARAAVEALETAERAAGAARQDAAASAQAAARQAKEAARGDAPNRVFKFEPASAGGGPVASAEGGDEDSLPASTFTYTRAQDRMDTAELERLLESLRPLVREAALPSVLWRALRRGVAVHHAGLPSRYRHVVEILFRRKHVRVVFASNSLAYGINMPCRTVVFAGDSPLLTPLQFQQMAGRAGRRGFDRLGHVVFFGIPASKQVALLLSQAPSLVGASPVSPAFALRLLAWHAGASKLKLPPTATADAARLLTHPLRDSVGGGALLLAAGGPRVNSTHFAACVGCLGRLGLLSPAMLPSGAAAALALKMVSLPTRGAGVSGLALAYLLQTGALTDAVSEEAGPAPSERLLTILAFLAATKRVHPAAARASLRAARLDSARSPRVAIGSGALPPAVLVSLRRFNRVCLQAALDVLSNQPSSAAAAAVDACLPLSRARYAPESAPGEPLPTALQAHLEARCSAKGAECRALSPFAMLSGAESSCLATSLLSSARPSLRLGTPLLPFVDGIMAEPGAPPGTRERKKLPLYYMGAFAADSWWERRPRELARLYGVGEAEAWAAFGALRDAAQAGTDALRGVGLGGALADTLADLASMRTPGD